MKFEEDLGQTDHRTNTLSEQFGSTGVTVREKVSTVTRRVVLDTLSPESLEVGWKGVTKSPEGLYLGIEGVVSVKCREPVCRRPYWSLENERKRDRTFVTEGRKTSG